MLFAESIPHLLHWDLAYLWVLEKEANLRPASWRPRIEAWRYLVTMLAAGELSILEEPVPRPLSDYTEIFGIDQVQWVVAPQGNRKIGVLSPITLVRPLPDFKEEDLDAWDRQRWVGRLDEEKKNTGKQFVAGIIRQLRSEHTEGSFQDRLAIVLAKEFGQGDLPSSPTLPIIHRTFPSLSKLSWGTLRQGTVALEAIELPIHKGPGTKRHFVPHCTCGKSLLQRRESEPFVPSGDETIDVTCVHCGATNKIAFDDLLIWNRSSKAQAIVWKQDQSLDVPALGYPPEPKITGSDVIFEWDSLLISGNKDIRFLKLRFPNYIVASRNIADVFYSKLLVPGSLREGLSCVPFQFEWIDSARDLESIEVEVRLPAREVVFRKIRVRGWASEIKKVYAGDLGLHIDPGLSVGVFPDPEAVVGDWRWFRIFLEGHHRDGYRLVLDGAQEIIPTLNETLSGLPEIVSVTRRPTPEVGVTFRDGGKTVKHGREGLAYLGIDFGTSSSLVYFVGHDQVHQGIESAKHAVLPSKLASATKWLAGDGIAMGGTIAAFLPLDTDSKGRTDPYLIPSALWQLDHWNFIRWSSDAPSAQSRPATGFKLDKVGGADHSRERESFLSELVLVSMPYILAKLGLSRLESVEVKIGMAFPLAIGTAGKRKMLDLLNALQSGLQQKTGLRFDFYSVNEAIACVDAFGAANKGETYLIADLGGATLDVALYTSQGLARKPDLHQLGSLEFAGETFVAAFAATKETDLDRQASFTWQVRDDILEGRSRTRYGSEDSAKRILGRFRAAVFEYLRTMVATFHKTEPDKRIKLVLAGNGWHLSDAFDASTSAATWKASYREIYSGMVERLANEHLELYLSPEMDALPSTKHFVVLGALRNASGDTRRRQLEVGQNSSTDERESRSRLPCGRTLVFSQVGDSGGSLTMEWFQLVGEGAKLKEFSSLELRDAASNCELQELPGATKSWMSYLLASFGVSRPEDLPYPPQQRLREQILGELAGDPYSFLGKGPLQLILESTWTNYLRQV